LRRHLGVPEARCSSDDFAIRHLSAATVFALCLRGCALRRVLGGRAPVGCSSRADPHRPRSAPRHAVRCFHHDTRRYAERHSLFLRLIDP
jgi:hypothetical protein